MQVIRYTCLLALFIFIQGLVGCGGSVDVTVKVEGAGKVVSPGRLDCGTRCSTSVFVSDASSFQGEFPSMKLTAVPEPGYELLSWNNAQCSQAENPECTVPLVSGCGVGLYPIPVCLSRGTKDLSMIAVFVEPGTVVDSGWSPDRSCALFISGEVKCWSTVGATLEPPALNNPTQVEVGKYFACAEDGGQVVCWGESAPYPHPELFAPFTLAAGDYFICAQDPVRIACWTALGEFAVPEMQAPTNLRSVYPGVCVDDQEGTLCWTDRRTWRP